MAGNNQPAGPPPPPPPPLRTGPRPNGPGPNPGPGPGPFGAPRSMGGPPPPPRHPGAPPNQQQQKVISPNATRFSDLTPKPKDTLLNDADYRKALTTYEAHTIRKVQPRDPKKEKATWAKAEITREALAQDEISRQMKRLNESKKGSVSDKKNALQHFQQGQVNRLLEMLNDGDPDKSFEWSLVQIDQQIRPLKTKTGRETTTITCYCKRSLKPEHDAKGVYTFYDKIKQDRAKQMNAPPPQHHPPPQEKPGGPPGPGPAGGNASKLPDGVIKLPPKGAKEGRHGKKNHSKKYYDEESCSDGFDSDTDSRSSYSSSEGTSISSRSDHRRRSSHNGRKGRARSHSRVRRTPLYIQDRMSPEPIIRDSFGAPPFGGGPRPSYVPEVPKGIPDFDPVAAAYQAGKVDADAARFGVERSATIRPIQVIEPPRAVVTYVHPDTFEPPVVTYGYSNRYERRPLDTRADERYVEEIRYQDDLRYREDELRQDRWRRDAEDYIDRRASEPRILSFNANPFSPAPSLRRYSPSPDEYRRYRR